MTAYYNEFDPKAAAWLRELIKQGHIAPGDVDERSISDVSPSDLRGYTQCHFFAGIGVWSYALRKAGWSDDRPVWTGSCPCQPFSSAGKRKGTSDERHLWPHWQWLISQCRPVEVFGEQVASKDGRVWLDTVQSDMEALGFAVGAADLCAAGVGAPHIRQRLWFYGVMAESNGVRCTRLGGSGQTRVTEYREVGGVGDAGSESGKRDTRSVSGTQAQEHSEGCENGRFVVRPTDASDLQPQRLVDPDGGGTRTLPGSDRETGQETSRNGGSEDGSTVPLRASATQRLADDEHEQHEGGVSRPGQGSGEKSSGSAVKPTGLCEDNTTRPTNGFWRDADWLGCRDGKFRPVEPGLTALVDGSPARVGRLRGYGNAIVAPVAQTFIEATQGW